MSQMDLHHQQQVSPQHGAAMVCAALEPLDAIEATLAAMEKFPLVAVGEIHQLQELHDFFTALLYHPVLPDRINDIVVEFGNALYQDLVDRFVLTDQPVARADLQRIWRTASGNVLWDAPVYEQFFRTVRARNWVLPPERRLRVLLGDPSFDVQTSLPIDRDTLLEWFRRDEHYVAVIEKEVLQKGRRALLIAGRYHLLRGLHTSLDDHAPNAGTLLAQRHPDALFVIDSFVGVLEDPFRQRSAITQWPCRSLAYLAGTWMGAKKRPNPLLIDAQASTYQDQADALLYLGPTELLTASRADPALYLGGEYIEQLHQWQSLSNYVASLFGWPVFDLVQCGLAKAQSGPHYFASSPPDRK
jgi:hypothetical protein